MPVKCLWIELLLLFVLLPLALALPVPAVLLLAAAIGGLCYCIYLLKTAKKLSRQQLLTIPRETNWRPILYRLVIFCLVSTLIVYLLIPDKLFSVVLEAPILWISMSVFYALFSVYPQELIYRYFFFWRYQSLLPTGTFCVLNALLFSIAHTLFMNSLVIALTFAGGLLFAHTYHKSNSVMVTSIEHAGYGIWLYTLGIGEMLAFPGP